MGEASEQAHTKKRVPELCRSRIAPGCRLNRRATWCRASPTRVSASCTTFLISGYVRLLRSWRSPLVAATLSRKPTLWPGRVAVRIGIARPCPICLHARHIGGHGRGAAAPLHTVAGLMFAREAIIPCCVTMQGPCATCARARRPMGRVSRRVPHLLAQHA